MKKEEFETKLIQYYEKKINDGIYDEFIHSNFKISLNKNQILLLVLHDKIKNIEINNILSVFLKELNYSQDYFILNFDDEKIKIKLVELFLGRMNFIKKEIKKKKLKMYNDNNKEKRKEYYKEYYKKIKNRNI